MLFATGGAVIRELAYQTSLGWQFVLNVPTKDATTMHEARACAIRQMKRTQKAEETVSRIAAGKRKPRRKAKR